MISAKSELAEQAPWELLCEHGGNAQALAAALAISSESLLDLSSAVSPFPYPLPPMPVDILTRLPYGDGSVTDLAADCYGVEPEQLVAASGSQSLIQWLPRTRSRSRVLVPRVGYAEHAYWWANEGHSCVAYDDIEQQALSRTIVSSGASVLVLIHPNNPTGAYISASDLECWRACLPKDGLIVVDEAFIDATPAASLVSMLDMPGLIILRSVGKFFGLPGLRLGFALGAPALIRRASEALGPWPVSAPALWAARQFFGDCRWQNDNRCRLLSLAEQQRACLEQTLVRCMQSSGTSPTADIRLVQTPLFSSLRMPHSEAKALVSALLERRIAIRYYRQHPQHAWLRIGLATDIQRQQLEETLADIQAGLSTCAI